MVLTAYFVLSPVTGSLATVIRGYDASHTRLGGCTSAKLDASVGASGPHDFTVRDMHRSSARRYRSRETALRSASRDDAATSIASHPASVTIAIRPSRGCDGAKQAGDLGQKGSEKFVATGLDSLLVICPTGRAAVLGAAQHGRDR
jgi:hypothetical protein